MGVPKFFRYISERYPCLSELAREQSIPEFDNLYLDMNGIIHNCSHPDDSNIHFNITEEDMFKDIFNYIDKLFFLIKPQKLFYMAIDGVAPRAKMNQQRSRRFRSAKDAELLEEKALKRGEVRQTERFDSNCITPGTEFMARLHEALQYFVQNKMSTDVLWQKCRVIFSGHDCPGEGEHKIMNYIRYLKAQPKYDSNTRHCLYGLDADLIILGLCTHELHFVVLREEVKFGKKTKHVSVEETRFFLLHLGLLREYLELEFEELRKEDENFDIAKMIDDWVLMGFLVGNDFIPHLPCMHISTNALPILYKTYKAVYHKLGGNLNDHGKLNLARLEIYFEALAEVEYEIFQDNRADLKYFVTKKGKNGIDEAFDFDVNEIEKDDHTDNELSAMIENSRMMLDNVDSGDEEEHIEAEFETYKRNYYQSKLNKDDMNSAAQREQAICYITALQWVLDYYYLGVQSWDWYYPHHYAPFISDLKNFKDYKIKFNMGKPFLPFQQLLAVLPAASKQLLPAAYRDLMTSPGSPLINFYPNDFETDLNGKQHEWEAVVLIPFIDEKILLQAMETCDRSLTPSERKRNHHGPMFQYDYTTTSQGSLPGYYKLKPLDRIFCTEKLVWNSDIDIKRDKTVCIELPNARRTVFYPGFPTMKHLKYSFTLKEARVRVFDYPSRNVNCILMPLNRPGFDDIFTVAEKYLNQTIYIGWPHLIKAKVVAISNEQKLIETEGFKPSESKVFQSSVKSAQEHLLNRMGIEFSDFSVMLHVKTIIGTSYTCSSDGRLHFTESWSSSVTTYPAQGAVADIAVHDPKQKVYCSVEELFPKGSTVFFIGSPNYGSQGTVLDPLMVYECGRLQVCITVLPEPDFTRAKNSQYEQEREYMNSYQAAMSIGLTGNCLGRLAGSLFVINGTRVPNAPDNTTKLNIGLQLKYTKENEERVGYTRRMNAQWFYSPKAMAVIKEYCARFPEVVVYLSTISDRKDQCFESDIFPDRIGQGRPELIIAWLAKQPHFQSERITCGAKILERDAIGDILSAVADLASMPRKTVKLQVKPHLLIKPDVSLPSMYKSKKQIKLFDRVVIVKTTYMVPVGEKGTVVGLHPIVDPNPVRLECVRAVNNFYEVLFDNTLPMLNDIHGLAENRVYKVPETSLLLIFTEDYKPHLLPDKSTHETIENNQDTFFPKNTPVKIFSRHNNTAEKSETNKAGKVQNNFNAMPVKVAAPQASTSQKAANNIKDFWSPVEKKMPVPQHASPISAPVQTKTKAAPIAVMEKASELNAETQLLQNLLGMRKNMALPNHNAFNSESGNHILPLPPTSWKNPNQRHQHQHRNMPPLPLQAPPGHGSIAVLNGNIIPLPGTAMPALITQPSAASAPYFPVRLGAQNAGAQGNAFFNQHPVNQKSGFVPLQAMRGNKARNQRKLPESGHMQQHTEPHDSGTSFSGSQPNTQQQNGYIGASTAGRVINPKSKKPLRVPKIGAKFDNAH